MKATRVWLFLRNVCSSGPAGDTEKGTAVFAVVEIAGKQYRVEPGQELAVDLLPDMPGTEVMLDRVLLVSTDRGVHVGAPTVAGCSVMAEVVTGVPGEKLTVFKYKNKKRYRRTRGHRQWYTGLLIKDIVGV